MCGICGIIRFDNRQVEKNQLEKMMFQQKHRGPNDKGCFIEKSLGLGFVRLSVLDLSQAGHQPMIDNLGRFVIVFNGEIYNYIELREELKKEGLDFKSESDTEVLLTLYIRYGKDCLDMLNGMFAFAIYDKETKHFFAARDRFGVKPFYYHFDENAFYFSSEILPILSVYGNENLPNNKAIFDYLAFNRTDQSEETFFDEIKKLQHGHYIEIVDNKPIIKRWYNVADKIIESEKEVNEYKNLLIDAVKLRLRSDVPVGVCLSGGLDSSAITSIISKVLENKDLHTFSAVYNPGDRGDESKYIKLYENELTNMHYTTPDADELLSDLSHFVVSHSEPVTTTSIFAQYSVMKLAKDHVTVTLDGQGADEVLGGYHYFFGFYFKDLFLSFRWGRLLKEQVAYYKTHKSFFGFQTLLFFLLPNILKSKIKVNAKGFIHFDFIKKMENSTNSSVVNDLYASKDFKSALINHLEYKLEHLLKWNDRNSMAFSLESRTPFLDYRLIEFTLSQPAEVIIRNGYTKNILREAMKGILPEEIRLRKDKIGFATPEDEWFRKPQYQTLINEILSSESLKNRKIIDVENAKILYQKHLNKEINISKDIWKWINLEMWYRIFIDKKVL